MEIKQKKGISLIVLVITIIVVIILAAAIILSLNSSGIIDKANESKSKSDAASLKELYQVKYSESLLNNGEIDKEEILKETISEMNLSSNFDFSNGVMYTGTSDEIAEWIIEMFVMEDLAELGYIFTTINGETYVTGLDTVEKAKSNLIIEAGYVVKDIEGNNVDKNEIITTGYSINNAEGNKLAEIVYFGDVDSSR